MKRGLIAFCVVCTCAAGAIAGASPDGLFLYAPHRAEADGPAASGEEGVLVKEIMIRKGDTLSSISRSYSGRASYYPQILLFNQIANPNLIYAGKILRVPVAKAADKKEHTEQGSVPQPVLPQRAPLKAAPQPQSKSNVASPMTRTAPSVAPVQVKTEQQMYDKCLKAYREGACDQALPLFETFIREYPQSNHLPDVYLYKADCHLKLSGK